jgi:putative transposase
MAEENVTWGYRRIQGALANLGYSIDAITVRNILHRHHIEPAPQRRKSSMSWTQFLRRHWEVLAATDFFTVEVATWHGLVTYYVLIVMELAMACTDSRDHSASHHGLYAAMRPGTDGSF